MRIFISDVSGFAASFAAKELQGRGHALQTLASSSEHLDDLAIRVSKGTWDDESALDEALAGADVVVHFASVRHARKKRDYDVGNIETTRRLLSSCARVTPNLGRFVLVSSLYAAGPSRPGEPRRELDPEYPVSHYGQSLLKAERLARTFRDQFEVTIARPGLLYGPGDVRGLELYRMVQKGSVLNFGRAASQWSLLYVEDAALGIAELISHPKAGNETFFLTGPGYPNLDEMVDAIGTALGTRASVQHVPGTWSRVIRRLPNPWAPSFLNRDRQRELRAKSWMCSSRKARKILGWSATTDFRQGAQKTAEWYLEQGWLKED